MRTALALLLFAAPALAGPDEDAAAALALAKARRSRTGSGSPSRSAVPVTPNTPPAGAGTDEGRAHPPGNAGAAGYWGWHPAYGTVFVRTPAPGVAARQPFRGAAGYHAGHSCPSCGTTQYRIAGHNPDGTHTHVCPACGTAWVHR